MFRLRSNFVSLLTVTGLAMAQDPKATQRSPAPQRRQEVPVQVPTTDRPNPNTGGTKPGTNPQSGGGGMSPAGTAAIGGGAAIAGLLIGRALAKQGDPVKMLDKKGPFLPPSFGMSTLTVRGFVRRNWPAVVEYTVPQRNTMVILSVVADNGVETWYVLPSAPGRVQQRLQIPPDFSDTPTPALYSLRALNTAAQPGGPSQLMPLHVHAIGAGDRAVGSVGIDRIQFGPREIRPKQKQAAEYGFHAHKGFNRVIAEFMTVHQRQGYIDATMAEDEDVKGEVRADQTISNLKWKPKKKTTLGEHFVQIRGWMGSKQGDWVIAWSQDRVTVTEQ